MPANSQRHHGQVNGGALVESDQRLDKCQSIGSSASWGLHRGVSVASPRYQHKVAIITTTIGTRYLMSATAALLRSFHCSSRNLALKAAASFFFFWERGILRHIFDQKFTQRLPSVAQAIPQQFVLRCSLSDPFVMLMINLTSILAQLAGSIGMEVPIYHFATHERGLASDQQSQVLNTHISSFTE